jgi:HK97 gp10 family phage protein
MKISATARYTPRTSSGQFIAARVTPAVTACVEAACSLVAEEAKALCPVGPTGDLRNSISFRVDAVGSTIQGTVYAGMFYAGYVEFGTGRRGAASAGAGPYPYKASWPGMVAQPFLRPALDMGRDAVMACFRGQIALGDALLTGGGQ